MGVARAPDGTAVYFGQSGSPCGASGVFRVPADGSGPATRVADGALPAVSPDGTKLAYADARAPGICLATLVVRDLSTGTERAWQPPPSDGYFALGSIQKIDWAPDSRTVVFSFQYEGSATYVLDTATEGRLDEAARLLRVDGVGAGTAMPAWRSTDDRIAVVVDCCPEPGREDPSPVLLVGRDGREPQELLASGTAPRWLDFDAAGRLLWVGPEGALHLGRDAPAVRDDVLAADW
jgi:Tol biopolymer transport system component